MQTARNTISHSTALGSPKLHFKLIHSSLSAQTQTVIRKRFKTPGSGRALIILKLDSGVKALQVKLELKRSGVSGFKVSQTR